MKTRRSPHPKRQSQLQGVWDVANLGGTRARMERSMAVSKALALTTLFSKARRGHLVAQAQTKFREVNFPRDNPLMGAGGGQSVSPPSGGTMQRNVPRLSSPAHYPVGNKKIRHVLSSSLFLVSFPFPPASWITSQINYCTHAFISGPAFGGTPTKMVILPLAEKKPIRLPSTVPPQHTHLPGFRARKMKVMGRKPRSGGGEESWQVRKII